LIDKKIDYEKERKIKKRVRFKYLELSLFVNDEMKDDIIKMNDGDLEKMEVVKKISIKG
jgi:hypothetical protein